jgi:hypothetical protein
MTSLPSAIKSMAFLVTVASAKASGSSKQIEQERTSPPRPRAAPGEAHTTRARDRFSQREKERVVLD